MIKGYIYSAMSAILFGSAGVIIKLAFAEGAESISLLTLQYIIAVALMFFLILITNRSALKISKRDLYHTAVLGIVGNTFMTVFYYLAFSYLDVSLVAILLYTYPIIVFMYSFIFERESITRNKLIALIMAFVGCFLSLGLIEGVGKVSVVGIGFGLLAAVFFAFMNIYSEKKLRAMNPLCINFYSTAFSLLSLVIYQPPTFLFSGEVTARLVILTAVLAVICEIMPLTLLYAAIKYIGSLRVSIIGNLEIPTAMVLSYILLKETAAPIQILGAAMVIYAAYSIKKENA